VIFVQSSVHMPATSFVREHGKCWNLTRFVIKYILDMYDFCHDLNLEYVAGNRSKVMGHSTYAKSRNIHIS
jgi:hypothetical protein